MSKYEVMYIINANVEEEKRSALIEQLNDIIIIMKVICTLSQKRNIT